MRDFRDAKAMAHSLRDALTAKSVQATHSESLELIAKAFGYDNWNILSAKIDAARPPSSWPGKMPNQESQGQLLYCSFCGKSQHEVNKLVAGPAVYICDECIDLCTDIVDEHLLCLIDGDREAARALSTDRLQHYVVHAERGAQRNRLALQRIERVLALHENRSATDSEISGLASFARLRRNTPDELRAMQGYAQAQLKSYEQALRTAMVILGERSGADSAPAARLAKTEIADAGESDQHQRPG